MDNIGGVDLRLHCDKHFALGGGVCHFDRSCALSRSERGACVFDRVVAVRKHFQAVDKLNELVHGSGNSNSFDIDIQNKEDTHVIFSCAYGACRICDRVFT